MKYLHSLFFFFPQSALGWDCQRLVLCNLCAKGDTESQWPLGTLVSSWQSGNNSCALLQGVVCRSKFMRQCDPAVTMAI